MNFKSLLLLTTASVLPGTIFAADYYVTPDGAGLKDGSSWENAFGVAEFRTQAAKNANGDVYHFDGGLYNLSEGTVLFKTATGATLLGNTEGERTVFSGDKNSNNNPESGDAGRLIRLQANTADGNTTNPIVIENIDFTCVYTYCDNDDTNMGALVIENSGYALVKNCRFYNNWAQGSRGGAAITMFRTTVKFLDCQIYNNSANYRGGAIRLYSKDVGKGKTTFENCVIKNNKNYHNLGGAIFMGHGNSLNIINSTITGNSAVSDGGAIYFNGYDTSHNRIVRIVNSTIANNTTSEADDAQIVSTQDAHISVANSIITCTDDIAAIKFKGTAVGTKFEFVSGGYNYVGNVIEPEGNEMTWTETDTHGAECTYSSIFGENTLNAENVIKPATFVLGATGTQVTEAVAEWGLPTDLDLTVDQLGNKRLEDMTTGAYAVRKENINTGIDYIASDCEATITQIADGVYAINGAVEAVTVYNLSGTMVKTANADNIDLSTSAAGLYIIRAGNNVFKVIK